MANSLLFKAVSKCRFSQVKALVENGLQDVEGRSLLMAALQVHDQTKRQKMFLYLLRRGADTAFVDGTTGRDVLSMAVCLGREGQVKQLLNSTSGDIDLQHKDNNGLTALHYAVLDGQEELTLMIVQTMQHYHLSVDIYDAQGMTPYIHARRLGHHKISEILIQEGHACPSLADKHGFHGADEWEVMGVMERRQMLREHFMQEDVRRKISGRLLPKVNTDGQQHRNNTSIPSIIVISEDGMSKTASMKGGSSTLHSSRGRFACTPIFVSDDPVVDVPDFPFSKPNRSAPPSKMQGTTLNIMENAAILTGTGINIPKVDEFKCSEFDVNKQNEYKTMDVTQLMTSLSDQQSSAFRKTVTPRPNPPPPPVVLVEPPKREKVSTLAILMGKAKQKSPRRKKPKGDKKSKKSDKKKTGSTSLPQIKAW